MNADVEIPSDFNKRAFIKHFLVVFLPLIILIGGFLMMLHRADVKTEIAVIESEQRVHVALELEAVTRDFSSVATDLMYFSKYHELVQLVNKSEDLDLEDLKDEFLLFSEQKKIYDQIRFLDETGREVIKVDSENERCYLVPEGRLQSKAHRYYFKETMKLNRGELFISKFDLNMEEGKIEQPVKPIIRFGTPIYDRNNEIQGVLVFNYLGAELIHNFLKAAPAPYERVSLLNHDGYWISSPDLKDEFGFMYEDKKDRTFANVYPGVWEQMLEADSGQFYNAGGLFTFVKVYPLLEALKRESGSDITKRHKGHYWIIASHVPEEVLTGILRTSLGKYLKIFVPLFIVLSAGSWFFTKVSISKKQAEDVLRQSRYDLGERVKELTGLYSLGELIEKVKDMPELFQILIKDIIPPSMQFPDKTISKIEFAGKEYGGEKEFKSKLCAPIMVMGKQKGEVCIGYTKDLPFIEHFEQKLVNGYAEQLGRIIERNEAEEALKESEKSLAKSQQIAHLGNWDWDIVTNDLWWSDEIYRIFGAKPQELEATYDAFLSFVHPDDRELVESSVNDTLSKRKPYSIDHRIVLADGAEKVVHEQGEVLFDGEKPVRMVGIIQDITDFKRAYEGMNKAKEAAIEANRAKSIFLANMSHEIRTPMNAILGFSELLEDMVEDEEQKEYLAAVSSSGKTLLRLINDILDLSKIEAGKLELHYNAVDICSIFNEIKQVFSEKIKHKELVFLMEIDPSLPRGVLIDEVRLRQVLLNLVGNSVKFTHTGHIKLAASYVETLGKKSTINLIFSVEDTGIGIPKDQQELIFEEFKQQGVQIASKYGGTGLGLAITRRLVKMMGGEVFIDSKPGKGSTFSIIIKDVEIVPLEQAVQSDEEAGMDYIKFNDASVLVADDVDFNRDLLEGFLKDKGINIIEARDGKEAVELTKLHRPDLVLMDVKMPKMNGYEAAKVLKDDEDLKTIPIIILTAFAMKESEETFKSTSGDSFLTKPVSKRDLIIEMMRYLPYYTSKVPPDEIKEKEERIESLAPEIKDKLPELLGTLKTEMLNNWNDVNKTFIIDEIEEFADKIKKLGEKYSLDIFTDWGDALLKQSRSFDMERLPGTLNHFPKLIEKLEGLV
jgi:PAS domain S-box-containing protein